MTLSETPDTPEGVPHDTSDEPPHDPSTPRRPRARRKHDDPAADTPPVVAGASAAAGAVAESIEVAISGVTAAAQTGAEAVASAAQSGVDGVAAAAASAAAGVAATAGAAARGVAETGEAGAARIASDVRAETAAGVQELEVEIRDHGAGDPAERNIAAAALRLIRENLVRLTLPQVAQVEKLLRENVLSSDYLDPDFWRGIAMVLQYQVEELTGLVRRRARGEYTLDAYGMDQELVDIVRPFAAFMYRTYFRVTASGLDNVPGDGAALLVANRSGIVPWDGVMIATALLEDHPSSRLTRTLHSGWMASVPGLAPALASFGQVPALPENAARLLDDGQIVTVFPEGDRGSGKLIWDRYRLAQFEAEGYVRAALRSGAPILPVAVVGAEEVYPMIADVTPLARLLRLPHFPLTPLFPWLGALGALPLPTKWMIAFDAPIATAGFGPQAAEDTAVVTRLCELVRARVQGLLDEQVGARKSVFFGR